MQSKVKKEEFKYNIMKMKIKLQENNPQTNNKMDITNNHWRIKKKKNRETHFHRNAWSKEQKVNH